MAEQNKVLFNFEITGLDQDQLNAIGRLVENIVDSCHGKVIGKWEDCENPSELGKAIKTNPRAWKLMLKQKPFVVVACDEPYFFDVYKMIRSHEIAAKRWSREDQANFDFQFQENGGY